MKSVEETRNAFIAQGIVPPTTPCEYCTMPVEQLYKNRSKRFCNVTCSNRLSKEKSKAVRHKRRDDAGNIICGFCGKQAGAINKQGGRRKWCSAKCRTDVRVAAKTSKAKEKLSETTQCEICNKTFLKYNEVKGIERRFCSKLCYTNEGLRLRRVDRAKAIEVKQEIMPCDFCFGEMKKYGKNGSPRRFCSRRCKGEFHDIKKRLKQCSQVFTITDRDWMRLKNRFNNKCVYCSSKEKLTLDHVVPVSLAGPHSIGNVLPACQSCNSSKRDRTLMEWRFYLNKLPVNHPIKMRVLSQWKIA